MSYDCQKRIYDLYSFDAPHDPELIYHREISHRRFRGTNAAAWEARYLASSQPGQSGRPGLRGQSRLVTAWRYDRIATNGLRR